MRQEADMGARVTRAIVAALAKTNARAGVTYQSPRQFEFEQRGLNGGGKQSRLTYQFIHRHRCRAQQSNDRRPVPIANLTGWRVRNIGGGRRRNMTPAEGLERLRNVRRRLDQSSAVADQLVTALRAWVERRTGYCHDFAPIIGGKSGGDQRA